ncbi:MAG: hypothetical protein KDD60_07270 [Bdellovibrionales bacterium]|nr:hypothetical protein [Bdellovibrionales bacterium]
MTENKTRIQGFGLVSIAKIILVEIFVLHFPLFANAEDLCKSCREDHNSVCTAECTDLNDSGCMERCRSEKCLSSCDAVYGRCVDCKEKNYGICKDECTEKKDGNGIPCLQECVIAKCEKNCLRS